MDTLILADSQKLIFICPVWTPVPQRGLTKSDGWLRWIANNYKELVQSARFDDNEDNNQIGRVTLNHKILCKSFVFHGNNFAIKPSIWS